LKKILVVGSEGQVGQVFVEHLLKNDFEVIGIDKNDVPTEKIYKYYQCDITKTHDLEKVFRFFDGKLDILLNLAGVSVFSPFENRTSEEIDFVLDVNVKANILLSQIAFNECFKANKSGIIVNMGSIYGVVSGDMRIYRDGDRKTPEIYGASKAAVINLTKYFATYMAPYNVRVNCISPGGIYNDHNDEFNNNYSKKVPMNRMANSHELLSTLDYLISDQSSYVTGQNILVDGGFTAW